MIYLCTNRPEGFGPLSHRYNHILTSCFLDTILIPLCTWLYLIALFILALTGAIHSTPAPHRFAKPFGDLHFGTEKDDGSNEANERENEREITSPPRRHKKVRKALSILYYLFLLAQIGMCVLEIIRLLNTNLGIGLLPFTFVTLLTAAAVRFTKGLGSLKLGWRFVNMSVWIALAATNGVKVAEEIKEGIGSRKGSQYPVADQLTDVSVMVGVYVILAILELEACLTV